MKKLKEPLVEFEPTKPRFQTIYDPTPENVASFKPTKPSQTVPDMSMSIPQILDKYQRGIDPNVGLRPIYDDDDIEVINPMRNTDDPLTERQNMQLEFDYWKELATSRMTQSEKQKALTKAKELTTPNEEKPKESDISQS